MAKAKAKADLSAERAKKPTSVRMRKVNVALIDLRYHGRLYRHGSVMPAMSLRVASQMRAEGKIYARDELMTDDKASKNARETATGGPTGDAAAKPPRDTAEANEALTPGLGGVKTR